MQTVAEHNGMVLASDMRTFVKVPADATYIVYAQGLKQLHLRTNGYEYVEKGAPFLYLEEWDEMETFDPLLFEQLEANGVLNSAKLVTFFAFANWLGLHATFNHLAIQHGKKWEFVFPLHTFFHNNSTTENFYKPPFMRFLKGKLKTEKVTALISDFFALMDEKFESKLFNALVLFQSETGVKVDKGGLLAQLFDAKRNAALRTFLMNELS